MSVSLFTFLALFALLFLHYVVYGRFSFSPTERLLTYIFYVKNMTFN